jgi:outer membrane protein TolC
MKGTVLLLFTSLSLPAATVNMTLRQAVDQALNQNPDLVMARLDQQKAELQVRVTRDPFTPKLYVGSGAAYSTGYPQSIGGNPPSIVQARAVMSIYNAPQKYLVAEARENARTAAIDENARRDDVVYRTASMFLDVQRINQTLDLAQKQLESYKKVADVILARVEEGKELPVAGRQANVNISHARQRVEALQLDADYAEASLALVLGMTANDRVHPVAAESTIPAAPANEQEAIDSALSNSKEVKRLESQMLAKTFEVKSFQSARRPVVDLVAQYAMLARYAFQDFFPKFQRNNGQLGVSINVPLLAGSASSAQAYQAEADVMRLRTQVNSTRERIALDTRKGFQDVQRAETARNVAREDLELAREQLSVLLAQMNEGRTGLRQVEEARSTESERWIAFYEAQNTLEKAQLTLLRDTGTIVAALK